VPPETVAQVLAITCSEPPGEVTHWTGRAVAERVGLALRTIQRIWRAHRVEPHRVRTFKRSNDPAFAEKAEDIVGLYMSPPAHAVVLSIDEKSQIQALSRTRPGTPVRPGRPATMTHDYKRHGTTTLFAALNVLDGTVLGRCMQRHRHQEFIRFLKRRRGGRPGRQDRARDLGQLCCPQAPEGARLALAPSPLGIPFHADLGLVAERRRRLLLGAHATPAEARRLHLARRSPRCDQALHRRAQQRSPSLRLDETGQAHP